jgi:hypothetical protein
VKGARPGKGIVGIRKQEIGEMKNEKWKMIFNYNLAIAYWLNKKIRHLTNRS